MYVQIDGHGPIHVRLARGLRKAIAEGRLGSGDAVPPSRVLAVQLGVSRAAVVAAYDLLKLEGLLVGKAGSGTRVSAIPKLNVAETRSRTRYIETEHAKRASTVPWNDLIRWMTPAGCRFDFQFVRAVTNPPVLQAWLRAVNTAGARMQPMYPNPQGLHSLRSAIASALAVRRGIQVSPEKIVVTSGTQQALAAISRLVLNPGDIVDIEEPGYVRARYCFQAHGAIVRPRAVDREGLTEAADLPPAKLIFTTPAHQLPTGVVMSGKRRQALLHTASAWGAWVFEDDYDNEFRMGEVPVRALKADDASDRVIYSGTFSKTMYPGFGLGFLILPDALIEAYCSARMATDFGVPALVQSGMAHFLESGAFEKHVHRLTEEMHARRAVLQANLTARGIGSALESTQCRGMYSMVTCREVPADRAADLLTRARARDVGLYNGNIHFINQPSSVRLMLGYAGMFPRDIPKAVALLDQVLRP